MVNFLDFTKMVRSHYLESQNGIGHVLFSMFLNRWNESLSRANRGFENWEEIPIPKESIQDVYLSARQTLQFLGMSQTNSVKGDPIWEAVTEILNSVRAVLIKAYGVKLPEAKVISMVSEMVESGLFKATEGPNGEVLISLPEQGNLF